MGEGSAGDLACSFAHFSVPRFSVGFPGRSVPPTLTLGPSPAVLATAGCPAIPDQNGAVFRLPMRERFPHADLVGVERSGRRILGAGWAGQNADGKMIRDRFPEIGRFWVTHLVDAVGSMAYAYHANGLPAAEDGPWDSDAVSDTCDSHRQRTGLSLAQPAAGDWTLCQLESVVNGSAAPVAGAIWGSPTSVTVNGSTAFRYADDTFVRTKVTLTNGANHQTPLFDHEPAIFSRRVVFERPGPRLRHHPPAGSRRVPTQD